ncbi:hypothetical protein [Oscillibacter sp.]|uniref:hypothetical protein n=1 Tax=Oscillibacter sp. TaxID=1945593 RepID=UPI001B72D80F|nr:hypothetical protein [Oscillibacter sp.]MBP3508600.1 hypothetical protein [Oscillibacter sp.]
MDTKKEKKIIHRAWGVVAALLVIMAGAILEEVGAVKGSALYYISGVLAFLTFIGASGYCAHTLTELEKLG